MLDEDDLSLLLKLQDQQNCNDDTDDEEMDPKYLHIVTKAIINAVESKFDQLSLTYSDDIELRSAPPLSSWSSSDDNNAHSDFHDIDHDIDIQIKYEEQELPGASVTCHTEDFDNHGSTCSEEIELQSTSTLSLDR